MIERVIECPADVMADWRSKCSMIGDKVTITDGTEEKTGIFDDVDDEGYLLLRDRRGHIEKIHYGDVSVR
jgi:BirA family biotin operon repressor/biotin-[acetyl-CoA-carboxylase] ligase